MSRIFVLLIAACCAGFAGEMIAPAPSAEPFVRSVELRGASSTPHLATRAGDRYDATTVNKDVRSLWATGLFSDIHVEAARNSDGMAVVFQVVEKPPLRLHEVRIEPHTYGLHFSLPEGTPMDRARAQQAAIDFRTKLAEQGYTDAEVDPELIPRHGNKVDLHLTVHAGDPVRVKNVQFLGNTALDPKTIRHELHALRIRRILPGVPGVWQGWRMYPAYSPAAVQSDLGRLRSLYFSRGYFDAQVRLDATKFKGEDAAVRIYVNPGPQYRIRQWQVSGAGADSALLKPAGEIFRSKDLCACLFAARKQAEKRGVIDFSARLVVNRIEDGAAPLADLAATIEEGRAYKIGRIEFLGREKFSEAALRRNLLLSENDLLNEALLRKSVARLNRTGFFDPMDLGNVQIVTDGMKDTADLKIRVRERKRGLWSISGPVGPIRLAGPLQGSVATRLPSWGSGLLELSTYYASFSLIGFPASLARLLPLGSIHGFIPVLSLQRPYLPGDSWRSGFLIAPQLGWRATAISYAATQLGEHLAPLLLGDSRLTPPLAITVVRPAGDGELLCDPPKPRLATLRVGAALLLQMVGSVPLL
jgi:outer membrane protein insertion porin family